MRATRRRMGSSRRSTRSAGLTFAARSAVSTLLDAHVARCDENYSVNQCAEYVELTNWLTMAEELYACALEGIEYGSPAHARLRACEAAEFERGFNEACEDRATCKVHHLLAYLV